ncbi:MAG TPA: PadR family transcriptional regulator [Bryobacteraceae bacterium]|nr:PadR family transcriptional regulator [Bryobacteraceae bacterium]
MKSNLSPFLPLSPAILHILVALAGEDRHGYGIMQEVARQSEGQYKLGPGTLYDNLQKLLDQAIVEEAPRRSAKDDPRRRYYRLSSLGRRVLSAEMARMERLMREAKVHLKPRKA